MAFYARNFVFDDVPSEIYGLIISSSDSGEDSSTSASSDVELVTQEVFRRYIPYYYGSTSRPVLEFDAEISTTNTELTAEDAALVQKWLFGQTNYKILRIVQPDMEDYYFRCFLMNPQIRRVGNIIRGFTFTIKCDAPFAWGIPKTLRYTSSSTNNTHIIFNETENNFYTYPSIKINTNGLSTGTFLIKNVTDNNRTFQMGKSGAYLSPGDVINIDCDLQIVTANNTPNILDTVVTPVKFFRLLSGVNQVYISGNFISVEITYTPMKRMA